MKNEKIVYIVHAIDTEGPLYESIEAKFNRLHDLFKITLEPTIENLEQLKRKEINLNGLEEKVAEVLSGHLTNYNDTWDKVDKMLGSINSKEFRFTDKDSFGSGWVFNWHCLDHVGFEYNPRRRDMGYHNIFDHYAQMLKMNPQLPDRLHWHFHPMSTYRDAHRCATSFENTPELHQILCRKIIERNWFPTVFRAGFQTERPDSHWFLEQYIPFDISNMAVDDIKEFDNTIDFKNGRSGDWRLAPADWSIYQPHHDNYQLPGNCRRYIARALNVLNRIASIDQREMDKAFKRADSGLPTVVGMASHDFRNLETEVNFIRDLIKKSHAKYPEVKFKYSEAVEAFQGAIYRDNVNKDFELSLEFVPESKDDVANIIVKAKKGTVFGPQPYLAIRTKSRRYIHDNLDFSTDQKTWYYAFHTDTLPLSDVAAIGIAANDKFGNTSVKTIFFND